ncbi:MAG: prepilin-type N-terminal cleavage/methylation domain-containing protein [Deltaproteobacteria bacterium]|nr:prepilin-type N-terminal cleavage/methylation domain-containing protein [Deltaproteobacteria bacterium]MBT4527770.1 prepilin-type N-terminal cleavage/methylation domain-containing protein [Deltaproteobacteria bacterium]
MDVNDAIDKHFIIYQKGFSLIEILVALVIISTMTALFNVSFGKMYHKSQLKTASALLKQTLINSRLTAITQNLSVQHKILEKMLCTRTKKNQDWNQWNCKHLNGENINYYMKGQINFSSRGFASPKTIKIYLGELTLSLIININGSIREEFT